jgi:glucosamine kinase
VPYYLGIDGGGTKTTCAVGDEAQTLATAIAGPSNIVRVAEQQTRESLQQSVRQACAAAGITPAHVSRTCIGGAGAARPELAALVRSLLAEIVPSPIDVVGDMQIALEAAFGDGPGIIVIAGTGSIAYGRNPQGKTLRAGGWGFAVGDEGSAHWIGRAAISAVLRAADETDANPDCATEQSSLSAALLECWGMTSLSDLARVGNATPPPDFAALFPAVCTTTDELAKDVLSRAGSELARIAALISRRLFSHETAKVPVAMVGGVFRYAPLVREVFYNELRKLDPRVALSPQIAEPVQGALRMARRSAARNAAAESV